MQFNKYIHTYIHTYKHTYIHTYIHTHTHITGTEARTVAEMGTGTTITGTGTRIRSVRAGERRKSVRNSKIVVDAVRETGETRVEREKTVENKGLVQ